MNDQMIQKNSMEYGLYSVFLPVPALIPVPSVAESVTTFFEAHDRWVRSITERTQAERALFDAHANDERRMTALYDKGEGDDADPREETAAAEEEYKKAEARVEPSKRSALNAHQALRESVASNRKEWQKIARKRSESARDKMASALRTFELQQAELRASLGVLELLEGDTLPRSLHAEWTKGAFEVGVAVGALGDAVVAVDRRLREV